MKIISIKTIITLSVVVLAMTTVCSQNPIKCEVINPDLKGDYKGQCLDGRADGNGEFTFAGGSIVYVGHFRDGKLDGKGQLFSIQKGKRTFIKKGEWKDNVYVGDTSIAYEVKRTENLERYTVRKSTGNNNTVLFNFMQNGGRNSVSNLNISVNNGNRIIGGSTEGYENIIFPFVCQVMYSTQSKFKSTTFTVSFEIMINEPGAWEISLYN